MTDKTQKEILKNMNFSYSSANNFDTCPYCFKLTYIEKEEKADNAFAEFGTFCHKILEMYFKDELDIWDLADYYKEHYEESMHTVFPSIPPGMEKMYYDSGLAFFESFDFDKEDYETIIIEDKIELKEKEFFWVVKPDLVLRNKKTGENILIDYKTKKLKGTKKGDQAIIDDMKKQFYLYALGLWRKQGLEINKIMVWFIRNNKIIEIPVDPMEIQCAYEWLEETIKKIRNEKEWKPNNTKENDYFCHNICSFRMSCPHIVQYGQLTQEEG